MSSRILMTTVAAIALALPALAQDQAKPLETGQEPTQQLEPAKKALAGTDRAKRRDDRASGTDEVAAGDRAGA